uniref:Uncharacterized protein n=1 Tax=Helianthus annuus TaxID=4232 RepID=A0A251U9S7_HELAN
MTYRFKGYNSQSFSLFTLEFNNPKSFPAIPYHTTHHSRLPPSHHPLQTLRPAFFRYKPPTQPPQLTLLIRSIIAATVPTLFPFGGAHTISP